MLQNHYPNHVARLQENWEQALLAEGFTAAVVHSGSPIISFLDDYVYSFRPNPLFLAWLPLTHHHDSVLLIQPGTRPQLWYYQPEDYWHMPPSDPDLWWAEHFKVHIVTDTDGWKAVLRGLTGRVALLGDCTELQSVPQPASINPAGLIMRLHLQRTRKSEYELACMRAAADKATRAHSVAREAFMAGHSEYDIHLAYLSSVQQTDAELPYHSIVALNEHAAVLHYQQRLYQAPARPRSFLIDAGACQFAYAADITRTYAAQNGEFSELIAAMDRIELELAAQVRAGQSYPALHLQAHWRIAELLQLAGISNLSAEDAVSSGLSSVFFPHGLGHFIGLQTHDVAGLVDNEGKPIDRPQGHPYLRLTRDLEVGNVLTIEPGLYFIPSLLEQWKQRGDVRAINWDSVERLLPYGGIRIEDNVVVTGSEPENLTRNSFAKAGL